MNPKLLKWLIIILVLIIIVGWAIFYVYQRSTPPVPSSPTPTPATVVLNKQQAFGYEYEHCLPFAQGDPNNPENLVLSDDEIATMKALLSPYGEVYGTYDDSVTQKACFRAARDQGVIGTVYFIVTSSSGGMEVATIKWQSAP